MARDYVPDHTFVVSATRVRTINLWKTYDGFALYPDPSKPSVKMVFGTVHGGIVKENIASLNAVNNGLADAVSKQLFDYAKTNISAISSCPEDYNIYKKTVLIIPI